MKKSKYSYFFEIEDEYIGYSYLSDEYAAFPLKLKEQIDEIIKHPDDVLTNADADIYKVLSSKKLLINDDYDEYNHLQYLSHQLIHKKDYLALTIVPTMSCNCRCPYCYELHPNLKNSIMSDEVVDNIKKYIAKNIKIINELHIGWFGGEPLLCMNIIQEISKFCINISNQEGVVFDSHMTTNGVLLNEKNIQILKECRINTIQITFDGPQEKHDRTRITIGGEPTFEIIQQNIKNYLDCCIDNQISLRLHVEADATKNEIDKILKILKSFKKEQRTRIRPYPYIVFTACNELRALDTISNREFSKCYKNKEAHELETKITDYISIEIMNLGFNKVSKVSKKPPVACLYELANNWVVRYDGYLTKCTVGLEKERALAKLTNEGIKLFPERFFKYKSKEFSTKLYEYCKSCELLPFCWQKCTYQHYLNPEFDSFIAIGCPKGKASWTIKQEMNKLIAHYKQAKVPSENDYSRRNRNEN